MNYVTFREWKERTVILHPDDDLPSKIGVITLRSNWVSHYQTLNELQEQFDDWLVIRQIIDRERVYAPNRFVIVLCETKELCEQYSQSLDGKAMIFRHFKYFDPTKTIPKEASNDTSHIEGVD